MHIVLHIFRYGKADGGGQAALWSRRLGVCSSQTGETSLRAGQRNSAAHENRRDVPQPQARHHQREGVCDFLIYYRSSYHSLYHVYVTTRHLFFGSPDVKTFIFNIVASVAFASVVCWDVTRVSMLFYLSLGIPVR